MHSEVAHTTATGFSKKDDYELIELISLHKQDLSTAELAWFELHKRHSKYLFTILREGCGGMLDSSNIEDLVSETLWKAFEAAETFKRGSGVDAPDQKRHIRGWLGRIATNLYLRELEKSNGLTILYPDSQNDDGKVGWKWVDNELSHQNQNQWVERNADVALKKQWVAEGFNRLNEREQFVLRATLEYEHPDRVNQRLPNAVSANLARELNTTPQNIRQIRKRAKEKVRSYVGKKHDDHFGKNLLRGKIDELS